MKRSLGTYEVIKIVACGNLRENLIKTQETDLSAKKELEKNNGAKGYPNKIQNRVSVGKINKKN